MMACIFEMHCLSEEHASKFFEPDDIVSMCLGLALDFRQPYQNPNLVSETILDGCSLRGLGRPTMKGADEEVELGRVDEALSNAPVQMRRKK